MVSGFIRSQRITTIVAIGGISIVAVTLYILLRKKSNHKDKKSSPTAESSEKESMSRNSRNNNVRENGVIPSTTVEEMNGKNKENAPIPEIITLPAQEVVKPIPEADPAESTPVTADIENDFEKLEVSKNGNETIERELSPVRTHFLSSVFLSKKMSMNNFYRLKNYWQRRLLTLIGRSVHSRTWKMSTMAMPLKPAPIAAALCQVKKR